MQRNLWNKRSMWITEKSRCLTRVCHNFFFSQNWPNMHLPNFLVRGTQDRWHSQTQHPLSWVSPNFGLWHRQNMSCVFTTSPSTQVRILECMRIRVTQYGYNLKFFGAQIICKFHVKNSMGFSSVCVLCLTHASMAVGHGKISMMGLHG